MMEKWQKLYYLALDGAAVKTTKVICGDTITYKVLLYIHINYTSIAKAIENSTAILVHLPLVSLLAGREGDEAS